MIEPLIARVFYTRNIAHVTHWRSQSFSQHMSLGEFYDEVIEKLDSFVESYQGRFELISGNIPAPAIVPGLDIIAQLQSDADFIQANRMELSQGVDALGNLLDDLSDTYLHTIYKLKNLK